MAPKRKAAGSGPTAAGRRAVSQGTLAFHGQSNKVSKSSRRSLEGKDSKTKQNSAILDALSPATTTIKTESKTELSEPSTAELSSIKQTESEIKSPLTAEEKQAQGVSEAQIKKYWKAKEAERKAPSIHQEDLSLYERVCRQWDVDGRYGVSFCRSTLLRFLLISLSSHAWEFHESSDGSARRLLDCGLQLRSWLSCSRCRTPATSRRNERTWTN